MKCHAIHQIVPTLADGDAISSYTLLLQDVWKSWGFVSLIFAQMAAGRAASRASGLGRMSARAQEGDVLVYHHSTGCDAAEAFIRHQAARKILIYHNIAPPEALAEAPALAARSQRGLRQLRDLAEACDLALADSEYNRRDLEKAGFTRTGVMSIALGNDRQSLFEAAARDRPRGAAGDRTARFLCVGRILPHKRFGMAIEAAALYQRAFGPARLRIVGGSGEAPEYAASLTRYVESQKIAGIEFMGKLTDEALAREYAGADVYFCPSLHEGFCVPLAECMFSGLPVIASAHGAVPETLGGGGLVIGEDDPAMYAESARRLMTDPALYQHIIDAQRARCVLFTRASIEARMREFFMAS
ncbi:MAG: glycosyltransferase family 4 protein [bacterium]|nr:glycosyltransferase family 4 protein [Candidatus Sumerlaeota bacterium]